MSAFPNQAAQQYQAGIPGYGASDRSSVDLFSAPANVYQLDVREKLVTELFIKQAFHARECTLTGISLSLKLPVELAESIFRQLKTQQLIEIKGMLGDDYSFCLSGAGKAVAQECFQISRYCGPAPVSLARYDAVVRAQRGSTSVNRAGLSKAFGDLTLEPAFLDQFGPAIVSQTPMLLFGPSGTGKSALSERIPRIFGDTVAVPYAIEVDGAIISVFDPSVHRPAGLPRPDHDPRWVFCERPCIIVGGELIPSMLELQRDSESGSHVAPVHMKANNGVFVIDDFGRQMISPRDLLNRWIVPLDRRTDYLAMANGTKFPVPFEVFVVFSTNLAPSELADEAFLRRLPNKIYVGAIAPAVFDEIVQRRLSAAGWGADPGAAAYLRETCSRRGGDLRPCYPRDLFRSMQAIAIYEGREPGLTKSDIDRAAELYFGGAATSTPANSITKE